MKLIPLLCIFLLLIFPYIIIGKSCTKINEQYDCSNGLICLNNNTCGYCIKDEDCFFINNEQVCSFYNHIGDKRVYPECEHKHFLPIHWRDIISSILIFFGSSVAGSSGLGGGGLFVPILYLINFFSPHEAVPLSKAIIFGGAVANFILNVNLRYPGYVNRLMIDYKVASLIIPTILTGTMLGVTLNVMFPSWLILGILTITLVITTWRTMKKGFQKMKEENTKNNDENEKLLKNKEYSIQISDNIEKVSTWKLIPFTLIIFSIFIEIIVILVALFKGSKEENIRARQYSNIEKIGIINWNINNVTFLSIGSFIGGILAGLVGIGGGMVSTPILLELGVHPQIVIATSSFLIISKYIFHNLLSIFFNTKKLFTSSSTTIQYLILGKLPLQYSLIYGLLSFFANIIGNLVINWIVIKYKKTYIIIFIISFVIGLSAIFIGISSFLRVIEFIHYGKGISFNSICEI